jgi:hypothetical protein
MTAKLTKLLASYLIVLVLLPFTAPWSVCGIADIRAAFSTEEGKPLPALTSAVLVSTGEATGMDPATTVVVPIRTRQRLLPLAGVKSGVHSSNVIVPLRSSLVSIGYPRPLTTLLDDNRGSAAVLATLRL